MTEAEREREAVVAWLRDARNVRGLMREWGVRKKNGSLTASSMENLGGARLFSMEAADAIERGDHLQGKE